MSQLIEDTPKKELSVLLQQIHEREIALPDFQRDFVWDPVATQELIVSIANDYPAGSLLAIRNTHNYFASREFEGAPPLNGQKPTYLILDGQQRLTSLYQAFYGVGEYQYFISIKDLIDGKDIDDAIFHVRTDAKRGWQANVLKKYGKIEGQFEDLMLPLKVLYGDRYGFLGWSDTIAEMIDDAKERKDLKNKLRESHKRIISFIDTYKFPIVLLSDNTPADAVCTIFETLNRTGVKLSVFDLLAARFWPHDVQLRNMWEGALEEHPILADYGIDPYYLLQAMPLLRTTSAPSCKRKDVLALSPKHAKESWNSIVYGMSKALEILRDDCGVLIPKWLPYNTMLVPFAAMLAKYQNAKGLKEGEVRQKLVRWFWCSVFGQAYETAPNSQTAKDFAEVSVWLEDGKVPSNIDAFSFDSNALFEVTPKQRALYRGVISLILSNGPRDFHKCRPLTRTLMDENYVDDHHIFPEAYLRDNLKIIESKMRDCVLNRTLIDRDTNQSISKRQPSNYLKEMANRLGSKKINELLNSHLLPTDKSSPLLDNDYEKFLKWRCSKIGEEISRVTKKS